MGCSVDHTLANSDFVYFDSHTETFYVWEFDEGPVLGGRCLECFSDILHGALDESEELLAETQARGFTALEESGACSIPEQYLDQSRADWALLNKAVKGIKTKALIEMIKARGGFVENCRHANLQSRLVLAQWGILYPAKKD